MGESLNERWCVLGGLNKKLLCNIVILQKRKMNRHFIGSAFSRRHPNGRLDICDEIVSRLFFVILILVLISWLNFDPCANTNDVQHVD